MVAYGDGGQTQLLTQAVDRRLTTFLQDIQNALAGGLQNPAPVSLGENRANSSTGIVICQIIIIIIWPLSLREFFAAGTLTACGSVL
jgi:hypothetical protein